MIVNKITHGFVIQVYDDNGKCVDQNFFAVGDVAWETLTGTPTNPCLECEYQPFDMVQPERESTAEEWEEWLEG